MVTKQSNAIGTTAWSPAKTTQQNKRTPRRLASPPVGFRSAFTSRSSAHGGGEETTGTDEEIVEYVLVKEFEIEEVYTVQSKKDAS